MLRHRLRGGGVFLRVSVDRRERAARAGFVVPRPLIHIPGPHAMLSFDAEHDLRFLGAHSISHDHRYI